MRVYQDDELRNRLKERLTNKQLSLCFSIKHSRTSNIARMAHACGYDALYVDLQHSTIGIETAGNICGAALDVGITPLVRVPPRDWALMGSALDGGAMGVIVSDVDSAEAAKEIVANVRYPPLGHRSVMTGLPHLRFQSWPAAKANEFLNTEMMVITIVESRAGIDRVEEIISVDGVDMILIGANDLCNDLGIPGQLDHQLIRGAYDRVIKACQKVGKFAGVGGLANKPELVSRYVEAGAYFVSAGADQSFMMGAASARAKSLREIRPD